jgi:hypothetical protein
MSKRKPKNIKLIYHYIGDDSPEEKAEAERNVDHVFDMIFDQILKNSREKKQNRIS